MRLIKGRLFPLGLRRDWVRLGGMGGGDVTRGLVQGGVEQAEDDPERSWEPKHRGVKERGGGLGFEGWWGGLPFEPSWVGWMGGGEQIRGPAGEGDGTLELGSDAEEKGLARRF